jgi:hypothetical protein
MSSLPPVESTSVDSLTRSARARQLICHETCRVLATRYATSLRAIVLTGSLARDEATFVQALQGVTLLGDVDLFVVFQDTCPLPPASVTHALAKQAAAKLAAWGVKASISFAMVYGDYFERLPQHISAYELRSHGLVLWGEKTILSLIPEFGVDQVCREDAWRLLANRLIEMFELLLAERHEPAKRDDLLQYHAVKLFLDMATSYLIFIGDYRSTYQGREEAIRLAAGRHSTNLAPPFLLAEFARLVGECTRFKVTGEPMACPGRELVHSALYYTRHLWVWELQQLAQRTDLTDPKRLMESWMAQQSVRVKIRGLASLARRTTWGQRMRHGVRWLRLSRRASPRYWVYHVAAELLFGISETSQNGANEATPLARDWKRAARLLPVIDLDARGEEPATCRSLARAVASNYRRFLESTSS